MPTLKQKEAFFKMIAEKKSAYRAMQEAGYSLNTAKNPKNLTQSKGFRELLLKYFPDEKINEVLNELISDKKDKRTRLEALREVIKLRDLYPDKKIKIDLYEQIKKEIFE